MIAKIKGKVDLVGDSFLVVMVGDLGYKVFVGAYTLGKVAGQGEVEFFVHTHVREDVLALYGFLTLDELEMFELLISISGIGPKAALGILAIADPAAIQTAVASGDDSILTRVSGVGKKTAGRVILELKNKIKNLSTVHKIENSADTDSLEALVAMGYSIAQARDALKDVDKDIKDVGERVKTALKKLGNK